MGRSEIDAVQVLNGLKNKKLPTSPNKKKGIRWLLVAKRFFMVIGVIFMLLIALAFTDYPFYAYADLGLVEANYEGEPEVIVMLGGEGMPSADGLMRCYITAEKASVYKNARIAIAIADNKEDPYELQSSKLMAEELMLRGVSLKNLIIEDQGTNTHQQAQFLFQELDSNQKLLIVTMPEHMTRAVASFKNEGFKFVAGSPVFEQNISEENLTKPLEEFGTPSLAFRYNLWSYLQYEVRVAREYTALAYYKLRGWI